MKNVNKNILNIIRRGIALVGTIACVFSMPSFVGGDKKENDSEIDLDNVGISLVPKFQNNNFKNNIDNKNNNIDNKNNNFDNKEVNVDNEMSTEELSKVDETSKEEDNIFDNSNLDNKEQIEESINNEPIIEEYSDDEQSEEKEEPKNVFISVKDYGVIGDGVTDDTKAIKKIINSCKNDDYYTIYFPSGNYLVSSSIVIFRSNIRIVGDEDTTISFPANISLDEDKRIVGVIVVKTINQDINNVVIENININVNASEDEIGNSDSLGRGITFIRQGKDENYNYYEMKDVTINNCNINNAYSYGIAVVGGERLKEEFSEEYLNDLKSSYSEDFDNRIYYDFYDIENLTISNCSVSNSRIGIRVNRVNNAIISNNTISNSKLENMTFQGENITVNYNKLYSHNGGCGSLAIDKCENIYIYNNYIDESIGDTIKEIWKTGICQNSAAGPSYNVSIYNNYIMSAARGIWIKNRLLLADPHKKGDAGSRAGAGFIIKGNKIFNSSITDIRIDELLDSKTNGEYVGNSYLYPCNCSVNLEAYKNNRKEVGINKKIEDIDYLEVYKSSIIKIAKVDENNDYIVGSRLQIIDEYGNIYGEYLSSDCDIIIDLSIGNYMLVDLDTGDNIDFSVENEDCEEQQIIIKQQINSDEKKSNYIMF